MAKEDFFAFFLFVDNSSFFVLSFFFTYDARPPTDSFKKGKGFERPLLLLLAFLAFTPSFSNNHYSLRARGKRPFLFVFPLILRAFSRSLPLFVCFLKFIIFLAFYRLNLLLFCSLFSIFSFEEKSITVWRSQNCTQNRFNKHIRIILRCPDEEFWLVGRWLKLSNSPTAKKSH